MPTVAQGIVKTTAIFKQVALGTPGAGAGGQVLRRVTSVFEAARDTFENNEIATHQQSTGVAYGLRKTSGKISGVLSPATYKLLFAGILRKDFVTGINSTALTNVTAASTTGVQGTFTRAAGSFITDGFKLGDVVRWVGWATTGAPNNNVNMLIIALTATVMTVARFDTTAVGAKAAGDSVTCTVVGKKTMAPTTGHTNDYFTFEEWYADVARSELFPDCKPGQIDIGLPASGNATFACDILGLSRTLGSAQVLTTPTAVTSTPVLAASNGAIWANGALLANVTGITITINAGVQAGDAIVGSNNANDLSRGRIKVSGQFQAQFTDAATSIIFDAETVINLWAAMLDNPLVGTSSFVAFTMPRIKITSDTPDDGEKTITRTYSFTAEVNAAGGAGTTTDATILTVQDSDA